MTMFLDIHSTQEQAPISIGSYHVHPGSYSLTENSFAQLVTKELSASASLLPLFVLDGVQSNQQHRIHVDTEVWLAMMMKIIIFNNKNTIPSNNGEAAAAEATITRMS